jgi:squalene-hopene/tetraprenyl-beta-curcumene cyclase
MTQEQAGKLVAAAREAAARTTGWLLERQHPDGHWCAELEGDTILESEYILLLAFLGREGSDLARRAARYLLEKQLPDGGWAMYPGGRADISGSVKAYFALKLTGHDPQDEPMQRARRVILDRGGADAVNSFTRYYLALLGQIPYDLCPVVPPQLVLAPKWFPVNLYAVSAWSRTIIVPLSVMSACRPVRRIEPERGIRELFRAEPRDWPPLRRPGARGPDPLLSWARLFRSLDIGLRWCQRRGLTPLRRRALEAARRWMQERCEAGDGLGAIFPPIVWSIIALRCLGCADDSTEVREAHRQLESLILEDPATGSIRLQPCKSPVWDTAIALRALESAGLDKTAPEASRAAGWLLAREIRRRGDWAQTVRAKPSGWCFEYRNDFYPDVDDTIMVLMALQPGSFRGTVSCTGILPVLPGHRPEACAMSVVNRPGQGQPAGETAAAIDRGRRWTLAMQNRDGGWGAFDRNNSRQFLCYVPFADHNAMIDPSTPDLTGRTLECLAALGYRVGHPAVDRGVAFLRRTQQSDGAWYGRWGVNYIYGTWQGIVGLAEAGLPLSDPAIQAGAAWLLKCQQACGGWGESADSYAEPARRGQGPPTASQTAWALMGLSAAGLADHAAVCRGIRYLLENQQSDGSWQESEFTGTGFPLVFYLRYHAYPIYFPLLALGRWLRAATAWK